MENNVPKKINYYLEKCGNITFFYKYKIKDNMYMYESRKGIRMTFNNHELGLIKEKRIRLKGQRRWENINFIPKN